MVNGFFENVPAPLNCLDYPSNHLQFSGYTYITQLLMLQIMTMELMPRTHSDPISFHPLDI